MIDTIRSWLPMLPKRASARFYTASPWGSVAWLSASLRYCPRSRAICMPLWKLNLTIVRAMNSHAKWGKHLLLISVNRLFKFNCQLSIVIHELLISSAISKEPHEILYACNAPEKKLLILYTSNLGRNLTLNVYGFHFFKSWWPL